MGRQSNKDFLAETVKTIRGHMAAVTGLANKVDYGADLMNDGAPREGKNIINAAAEMIRQFVNDLEIEALDLENYIKHRAESDES